MSRFIHNIYTYIYNIIYTYIYIYQVFALAEEMIYIYALRKTCLKREHAGFPGSHG